MKISAKASEGNAFAIMGSVRRWLQDNHRATDWPRVREEMKAKDYNHLCNTAELVTKGEIKVVDR